MSRNDRKWFLTKAKKACRENDMIQDGDSIAVGLSGGKDSSTLLYIMKALQLELPVDFTVKPIVLDLGFDMDITPLKDYCESLGYELKVVDTKIEKIIFDVRNEKNPCALCSNLRSGALNNEALRLNCNKVALGHHLDDVVETLFLNIIFTGKLATFKPKSFLDIKGITLIRPMVYLEEKIIKGIAKEKGLPEIENPCPVNKKTKREEIKVFLQGISETYPDFKQKVLTGLKNFQPENLW